MIVRLSDFKSNEYASLIGGSRYEPHEENPMIGFRGASRYVDPSFADCFALECKAMKRVRDEIRQAVWPYVEGNRLKPVMDQQFPLEEAAAAHARMEAGDHVGKIVLVTGS